MSDFIRMQPIHFLELQTIWDKDKRFPTVSSRHAWAHARNLDPDTVNRWWYRRRGALKLSGLTPSNEYYELAVGTPPLLEDDKSLVLKQEKHSSKGKKRKIIVVVPGEEEKENIAAPETKTKKARTVKEKKKARSLIAVKKEQVEQALSSVDTNYAESSSTVVPSSSPSRCSLSSLHTSSSPISAKQRAYTLLPPSSPPPDSDMPSRFPSPDSILASSPDLMEYFAELFASMNSVYYVPEHADEYQYCQQGLITALGTYTCCLCTAIPTANHDQTWSLFPDTSLAEEVFLPPVPPPSPTPSEQSSPASHHRESSPQFDTSSTIVPSSSPPSSLPLYDKYKIQIPYEPYRGTPRPSTPPPSYCLFGSRYRAADGAYMGECYYYDSGESKCEVCWVS